MYLCNYSTVFIEQLLTENLVSDFNLISVVMSSVTPIYLTLYILAYTLCCQKCNAATLGYYRLPG